MIPAHFRRMATKDIKEVAILLEAEEVVPKGFGREAAQKCLNCIAPYVGYFEDPKTGEKKLVAMICYELYERLPENKVIIELSYLAVSSAYQNQGVGSALLEFAEKKLREGILESAGIHRIFVFADEESSGFYEKLEFRQACTAKDFWGIDDHMIMMVRKDTK